MRCSTSLKLAGSPPALVERHRVAAQRQPVGSYRNMIIKRATVLVGK